MHSVIGPAGRSQETIVVEDSDDVVSQWLTPWRIATSEIAMLAFAEMKATPSIASDNFAEWLLATIQTFALGGCHQLAIAIAGDTGLRVVELFRPNGELAHAGVLDPATSIVYDVIGQRHVVEFRQELEAVMGKLSVQIYNPADDDLSQAERDRLLEIASAMPWMPMREGRASASFETMRRLIAVQANHVGSEMDEERKKRAT